MSAITDIETVWTFGVISDEFNIECGNYIQKWNTD
jgi:hypothetical protein